MLKLLFYFHDTESLPLLPEALIVTKQQSHVWEPVPMSVPGDHLFSSASYGRPGNRGTERLFNLLK